MVSEKNLVSRSFYSLFKLFNAKTADFGLLAGCLASKNVRQNEIKKLSAGIKKINLSLYD